MKYGILDLGTNTFNLLIVKLQNNKLFKILYENKIPVKLGKGGINKKIILSEAHQRAISAIKNHYKACNKFEVNKIIAFGTSGLRSAENSLELIKEIEKYNIEINIIDGNREAELIYKGIRLSLGLSDNPSLILDIGGGSCEFILCTNKNILWKKSYNIGVARMLMKFNPNDPITTKEINTIEKYLNIELNDLFIHLKKYKNIALIGSAGTFDTLSAMLKSANKLDEIHQTYNLFSSGKLVFLYQKIIQSTYNERLKMPGLPKYRAEYIVIAAILINFIINKLQIKKIYHSIYSLKEGALAELLEEYEIN